ncbi:MAG TPA: hypothetical protein VIS29_12990, partial [Streptomyces sp.]
MSSHRRPTRPGLQKTVRATVLSAAAATAATTLGGAPASADPQDTHESAKAAVDHLYEQAEQATERFNAATEDAERLRGELRGAQDAAARVREDINRLRTALGSLAGAQYRSGGIDPALELLLSSDPDTFLDRAAALDRVNARQAALLDRLRHEERRAAQIRAEAARALAGLEHDQDAVSRHRRTVEGKLARARQLLKSLPAGDRDAYGRGGGPWSGPFASGTAFP